MARLLPDLSITDIFVSQNCLIVIKAGNESGDVTSDEYRRMKVEIRYGGKRNFMRLPASIKDAGTEVTQKSREALCDDQDVTATLIFPFPEVGNNKDNNTMTKTLQRPDKQCSVCPARPVPK